MGRQAKPWFRKQDGWWYFRRNRLIEGKRNRDEAFRLWHELEAQPDIPRIGANFATAYGIANAFIDHLEKSGAAAKTCRWYSDYLLSFAEHVGKSLTVAALRPHHVTTWIEAQDGWASTSTRYGAVRAVRRAFRWASDEGRIPAYPLATLKSYPKSARETVLTQEQFDTMLGAVKDEAFRDVLNFVWQTGCRPQEVRFIEPKHVQAGRLVFPIKDSKGKTRSRVIFLNPDSGAIVARLVKAHPHGKLFLNMRGKPWKTQAFVSRFKRLSKLLGFPVHTYALRHTFATEGLKNGVDVISMSVLMGHSDTSTLARVYQHLAQDPAFMAEQATRAKKPKG